MTEANTQAVADEADTQVKPAVEVDGARDTSELSTFLDEYERGTAVHPPQTQTETKPVAASEPNVVDLQRRLDGIEHERTRERNQTDFDSTLGRIAGETGAPRWAVKGWLLEQAANRATIDQIFDNRARNPAAWNRLESGLIKEFAREQAKTASKVDPNATEDRAAVAAAVRGASTKAPEGKPVKLGAMTNNEFRSWYRETYGRDPGV